MAQVLADRDGMMMSAPNYYDTADAVLTALTPLVEARVRRDIARQIEALPQARNAPTDGDRAAQSFKVDVLALLGQRSEADHA